MSDSEHFLPEMINTPIIPEHWSPEEAIGRISQHTDKIQKFKHSVEDIIMDFWIAHEKIVKGEIEGWTWGEFCRQAGYHYQTPYKWFDKYQLAWTKSDPAAASREVEKKTLDRPLKKQTKPEVKIQLTQAVQAIKKEQISDDDLKQIGDALADKIKGGDAAPRVGSRISTAVKQSQKKKEVIEPKEIDNFERIRKSVRYSIEGLTAWADKRMKPETEDEAVAARAIIASGANMIIQYARLGLDIESILQTFLEGNYNEHDEEKKFHRAKQIN